MVVKFDWSLPAEAVDLTYKYLPVARPQHDIAVHLKPRGDEI